MTVRKWIVWTSVRSIECAGLIYMVFKTIHVTKDMEKPAFRPKVRKSRIFTK